MREDEARAELQAALYACAGQEVVVTQQAGGGSPDKLELNFPHGTFVVTAPRLWIDWRPT